MAKKLSTLIIDAVVNTSQIDQAAQRINSKLSSVGGRSYGGRSAGGSPFSAGITPYGMSVGGGGSGGLAAAAAAAAFGAGAGAIAARGSGKSTGRSDPFRGTLGRRSFTRDWKKGPLQMLEEKSTYLRYANAYRVDRKFGGRDADAGIDLMEASEEYGAMQRLRGQKEGTLAAVQRGMRRRARTAPFRAIDRAERSLVRGVSRMGLGTVAGGVVAGLGAISNLKQTEADMDEYNYIGTAQFEAAKQMRLKNSGMNKRIGYGEAFAFGANVGDGAMSKALGGIDDFFKTLVMGAAALPEMITNPFAAFAVMEQASPTSRSIITTASTSQKRNNI